MPTEAELALEQSQQGVSYEVSNIRGYSLVFTVKMESFLSNISNKPLGSNMIDDFNQKDSKLSDLLVPCCRFESVQLRETASAAANPVFPDGNGIYDIDMHDLVPNDNSIYNVSTKRAKHNLDSTYLWHYRLAHISKKRIEKLQQEGLLKSTDDELFDQCVSCLSGKMTRKSFPHCPERATDLLGIIHTDVCGLIRYVSRQGASYFITFTDDYSRYGYVYLLKHKHEVFETFKVFKNEVENQLGKTIKALRSDRGGEYISQEFKDYLKACGIVQQLTPPYTPQHNGDYALESTTRILNMVPTKKVDKTPYELWYGKVPNLSYLKMKIQSPSEITSEIPMEVEGFEPPQEEEIPIRRSERSHSESNKWIDAMNAEIQSIMDNMVWVLVDLPPDSRLVAKGYTQLYGVNYEETFLPVADIKAIRILMSIAAFYDYEIWQMDVKTDFLNGYLDEDIYMVQPEGFVDPNHPRKVCKLHKIIMVLSKHQEDGIKDLMKKSKDLGEATFILGIKIYRDRSKRLIKLGQNAYIDNILKRYKIDNSKRVYIPMQERLDLNKTQGASTPKEVKRMQNVPYASAVGSIMYAVRCIRPDIAFANTKDMFLVYGGNPEVELRVDCYCNAGFETDIDDVKSLTGYV
ncbi:retrotransposon protein, putative, ty1-copia subclass [Tanacetum coccineum]|uniref:Retrotransposon protein, putative, ty1-copia subclass n=1 Tax=Tanacetum coccineum TaxID=301880 RepID=A0ABQ5D5D4_9ASTR